MSSENSKSLLRAEHISKAYGEKQVLKDISIHLEQGELVSLLGAAPERLLYFTFFPAL